jgi:hypothetical protein
MSRRSRGGLSAAAKRLLLLLAAAEQVSNTRSNAAAVDGDALDVLERADLVTRGQHGAINVTSAGRAWLARRALAETSYPVDPFVGQHLDLARRTIDRPEGRAEVTVNDAESPLAWLARRKGRNGRPLVELVQLQAGERLRSQFTRAQLTPRVTANWTTPISHARRAGQQNGVAQFSDSTIAARQQVRHALEEVGPEFAGLLLDVCCFLKRLEDVERERGWPARSAKIVLQLALDRLARHYGLQAEARGRAGAALRTWFAEDAFEVA